jgi:hypothetical protein
MTPRLAASPLETPSKYSSSLPNHQVEQIQVIVLTSGIIAACPNSGTLQPSEHRCVVHDMRNISTRQQQKSDEIVPEMISI